jgi:hypothetical protein
VVDRAALGKVSSEFFSFCHSFILLIAQQSSPSVIQGWYNRPINGRSNSGLGSTAAVYINKMKSIFQKHNAWRYLGSQQYVTFPSLQSDCVAPDGQANSQNATVENVNFLSRLELTN